MPACAADSCGTYVRIGVLIHAFVPVCRIFFQHSGQEFHEDLYPDTVGTTAAMSAEEWWQGGNKQVKHLLSQHVYGVFTYGPSNS